MTVTPAAEGNNLRRYRLTASDAKPTVNYDTQCATADGWPDLPANGQISGSAGQIITVVELTNQGAKARGKARGKGEAALPAPTPSGGE